MAPLVLLAGLAGAAAAQTAAPAPAAGAPAAGAPAAAQTAAPAPAAGAPAADPAPSAAAAPGTPGADARKQCAAAMNADPQFAAEIVKTADEQAAKRRDDETEKAHLDANAHVQKNERHVIYAYTAMWLIAAAFVVFLWRRQQALNAEITQLRRDLDAAADDAKQTELRR